MTTKRSNNVSILSIHKERTDSINLVDIGHEFASKYDGRSMNLGKFVPSDLLTSKNILCCFIVGGSRINRGGGGGGCSWKIS